MNYIFYWGECKVFETTGLPSGDFENIIIDWVYRKLMPPILAKQFEGKEMNELAKYYESGKCIEDQFVASWINIEEFYSRYCRDKPEILDMIAEMKNRGYQKKLRAGQSMHTLIVSRARKNGLRYGQNSIAFWFYNVHSTMEIHVNNDEIFSFNKIELTNEIDKLLTDLAENPIN